MSSLYICFDNKFYDEGQAIFSVNRAMKFGDGLFESIRIQNGKPLFLDLHFNRLQKGLSLLEMNFSQQKWNEIRTCLTQLVIRNEIEEGGYVRLTVFRKGGGKYLPTESGLCYLIEGNPIEENSYNIGKKGLSIEFSEQELFPSKLSSCKTLNSLPYVLAALEREKSGVDELILKNPEGNVVEATAANIFLVFGTNIITPSIEEGCLDGVFRRNLINRINNSEYSISELPIESNLLERADEVFLTNTIQGIRWVSSFRKKRYFNKVARQLLALVN